MEAFNMRQDRERWRSAQAVFRKSDRNPNILKAGTHHMFHFTYSDQKKEMIGEKNLQL